jgi:hypothetical protein
MRVLPPVEEDQVAGMRPYNRTVPVYRVDVSRGWVVCENEFAAGARRVIGAKEKAGQRIRIDMALEPHRGSTLNVQDDAISIIASRQNRFSTYCPDEFKKIFSIELVQPGQTSANLVCMNSAARDV